MTQRPLPLATAAPHTGRIAFRAMSLLCLLLLLLHADVAVNAMRSALLLCARTVIPSLFPFMILSELIIRSGAATALGKLLSPLCRLLFGVSGEGTSAILLGLVSGFPVGARTAAALYRAGRIDGNELSFLLCFCNLPSSAFVISAVGITLFGSRELGILLYAVTLCSALLVGVLGRLLRGKSAPAPDRAVAAPSASAAGPTAFTDAVAESARSMLSVCAFVVFFATLVSCLEQTLSALGTPAILKAPLFAFFELTGGVSHASDVGGIHGMLLCAAALGWSGLSVHFQIMSICDGCPISFRPYFAAKAAQGLLNVLLLGGILLWQRPQFSVCAPVANAFEPLSPITQGLCLGLFVLGGAILLLRGRGKHRHRGKKAE